MPGPQFLADRIGHTQDPEATGDGSLIAIAKRQRTLLTTLAVLAGGGVAFAFTGAGELITVNAKATAAAPAYSEGANVPLSTDLAGTLRTTAGGGGGNPTGGFLDSIKVIRQLDTARDGRLDSVSQVTKIDSGRVLQLVRVVDSSRIRSWLGSTAPTVGQKTMANSLPTVIASDQSNINVVCVSGCAGAVEAATYTVGVFSSAAAASKDHLSIFNASGSGKVLKIRSITVSPQLAAAITGLLQTFLVQKTTSAGTTCTSLTIQRSDTTDAAVPAQVTANTNCTTDPTSSYDWLVCAQDGEDARSGNTMSGNCYLHPANGGKPMTLHEGRGISVRSGALSGAWPVHVRIEFTM